jgi:hypothetical protein
MYDTTKNLSEEKRNAISKYAFDVSKLLLGGGVIASFMKDEFSIPKAIIGTIAAIATAFIGVKLIKN